MPAINHHGDLALSWQTLWVGPLLCDSHVGRPQDVSDQLRPMLERHRALWKGKPAHFYADSGSSAGVYLNAIAAGGGHDTVSDNQWPGPLERAAQALPASAWQENGGTAHALLRHQPAGRNAPQLFAVSRRRDGLFDHYGFIACDDAPTDAARVGERHHLKGDQEQLFSEVLNGLDLHRPPCLALIANQIYYLIAALAYDLMGAIKLLDLTDDCQGWRIRTLMKKLVLLPGRMAWRSRQWVARVRVPGAWLCWWQRWAQRVWPTNGLGRPRWLWPAADAPAKRALAPTSAPADAGPGGAWSADRRTPQEKLSFGRNSIGCPPRTQPFADFNLPARPFARSNRQVGASQFFAGLKAEWGKSRDQRPLRQKVSRQSRDSSPLWLQN